ncbi:hypothetical protein [Scytonema sp. NUACC21]
MRCGETSAAGGFPAPWQLAHIRSVWVRRYPQGGQERCSRTDLAGIAYGNAERVLCAIASRRLR